MNGRQVFDEMNLEEYERAKYEFERAHELLRQAVKNLIQAEHEEKQAWECYYKQGFFDKYNEFEERLVGAQLRADVANHLFAKLNIKWDSVQQRFKEHVVETLPKEEQIHEEATEDDSKEVESETCDQDKLEPPPKLKSILKPTNYPIPINHDYVSIEEWEDDEEDEDEVEVIEVEEEKLDEKVVEDEEAQVVEVVKEEEEGHRVEPEFIDFVFAPDDFRSYERVRLLDGLPKIFRVGRRARLWKYPLPCHVYPRMVLGKYQLPEPTFYRNYTRVRGWSINDLKRPWQYKFNLVFEWCFGFGISQARSFSSLSVRK